MQRTLEDMIESAVSKRMEEHNERVRTLEERIDRHDEHLRSLDQIASSRFSQVEARDIGADIQWDVSVAKKEAPFRFYFKRTYGMEFSEAEEMLEKYKRFDEVINMSIDTLNMEEFQGDKRAEKIRELREEVVKTLREEGKVKEGTDGRVDEMKRLFDRILVDFKEGRPRFMAAAAARADGAGREEVTRILGSAAW